MRCSRVVLLLQLATLVLADPVEKKGGEVFPRISGAVLEVGTGNPVADVEVRIALQGEATLLPQTSGENTILAKTGVDGTFRVNLRKYGTYAVSVQKSGWGAAVSSYDWNPNLQFATVTEDRPDREITFWLARAAEVIGRVIDSSTGAPLSKGLIMAWQMAYREGVRIAAFPAQIVQIYTDGTFRFAHLPPGPYTFVVPPEKRGAARIIPASSDKDIEITEKGFEDKFWPGGLDISSVMPVSVASGAYESLGDLKLRPVTLYRVSGVVEGCEPDERFWVSEKRSTTAIGERIGEVECGKRFLLTGLSPGLYRIQVMARQSRKSASVDLTIKDKGLNLVFNVVQGGELRVQVTNSEKSQQPALDGIAFEVQPVTSGLIEPISGRTNSGGQVTLSGLPFGKSHIQLRGVPRGYYVKQILCNGSLLADDAILEYDGKIDPTSVTVVLEDRPASIYGTVRSGDKPMPSPYIVLARWPVTGNIYHSIMTTLGSEDGKFVLTALPEGEYRLAAISAHKRESLQRPSILERVLALGERISLSRGAFQNAELKETDVGQ